MNVKQICFTSPGKAELVDAVLREPGENDVLLKTIYSAISGGTERANLRGEPNTFGDFPKKEGYCAVSVVAAVGGRVTSCKVGDRVLAYHGNHAAYAVIPETQATVVTDDSIDSKEAALVILAAMGLGGVRRLELEIGESAMVIGLGILGLTSVMFENMSGASPVIAIDYNEKRRADALRYGADFAFDPRDADFAENIRKCTGGKGLNAIVEVTGAASALNTALSVAAREARISLLGCTRVSDSSIDYYKQVHVPGIKLIGAHNKVRPLVESRPHCWTQRDDCRAIMRLISNKRLSLLPLVSEIADPTNCPAVYDRLLNDPEFPLGVLFDWSLIKN